MTVVFFVVIYIPAALDTHMYVCCGRGEKLQPVGYVRNRAAPSDLNSLRVLLIARDGAMYVHHMRTARLCRLASSVTEFARRGLQRESEVYEDDVSLPDRRVGSATAIHLFDVITQAADVHDLLTVAGLCQTHTGVSCQLWYTDHDPHTVAGAARFTLTVARQQYRLWPNARRKLLQHLHPDHPLGLWLLCAVLTYDAKETNRAVPPVTPEAETVWVIVTGRGAILGFWPESAKMCRLASSMKGLWKNGARALKGHWTYAAPGRHRAGEAWPLCAHYQSPR